MHITGLPTLGPVEEGQDPRGYHYKVTEIGIYKPDEVNPDYVAPGGTLNPSAERQENIKEHTFLCLNRMKLQLSNMERSMRPAKKMGNTESHRLAFLLKISSQTLIKLNSSMLKTLQY